MRLKRARFIGDAQYLIWSPNQFFFAVTVTNNSFCTKKMYCFCRGPVILLTHNKRVVTTSSYEC